MLFRTTVLVILFAVSWSCAQQGSPTGGPRDEDPPFVLESTPPNYSTGFEARKIQITFDEYIVLDNVNQELVVSPPLEKKPKVRLKGKTLLIEFEEDLKDSTTYTLNFGSAIKDLHEGNKLLNFEYVFSTGDVLDSLSLRGTLKYAENLTVPKDPITILLYEDLRDSVPLLDIPLYVGRSNDSGVFSVNNLKADTFKVFALKDGNYNLLFDLPTEEIAFLDSNLILNAELIRSIVKWEVRDTSQVDTIQVDTSRVDTTGMETDSLVQLPDYNAIYIDLLLFIEELETQYITEEQREDRRMIRFVFARPLTDSFSYRFLTGDGGRRINLLEDFSQARDSLTLWLRDSLDYRNDSLLVELNYTVKDSSLQYVTQSDTLLMTYREKTSRRKNDQVPEKEKLIISTLRENSILALNSNLKLDFSVPLEGYVDSLIHLWHIPDTVEIPISFLTRADTMVPTRGWIDAGWESSSRYHVMLLPGAVSALYGLEHDTIDLTFRTRDIEYYGQILLSLEEVSNPVIIQLTSRDQVVSYQRVYESGLYSFSFLSPGDYGIKIIHDLNDNGKWDTGNYLKKTQPEPVEILPVTITVRSNWDHEVKLILEK